MYLYIFEEIDNKILKFMKFTENIFQIGDMDILRQDDGSSPPNEFPKPARGIIVEKKLVNEGDILKNSILKGTKIIKINKDNVIFEKDGNHQTQKVDELF